ncbi:MAG TPA: permease [Mycobacteriales bacterium]|nr:permease [Mycobacteriales bacterium]
MGVWSSIGDSLNEAFFMLSQTLWTLVLGFTLSGLVQAYVSRRTMARTMGDHRPASIARASLWGAASSSCSYAAASLARSLFGKGADFTTAIVFMVASTNLVVELGLVMWRLIGWQFAAAELVGGAVMIVLLSAILPRTTRSAVRRTTEPEHADDTDADDTDGLRDGLRDAERRRAAARYTIADLTMLRREIVIGFVFAGFLAVGVPARVWASVFVTGHGAWTAIENAVVGPVGAAVSFVCSIGNVPLAAALWQRGVSFGGVIAFVFADLLSLPLILIYRKLYGGKLTVRLVATLWLAMSLAGLATDVLMHAVGGIPHRPRHLIAPEHFAWDATTVLNIVAIIVLGLVIREARKPDRSAGTSAYAIDPVCGMQVERRHAPATLAGDEGPIYFCSEGCRDRYLSRRDKESVR